MLKHFKGRVLGIQGNVNNPGFDIAVRGAGPSVRAGDGLFRHHGHAQLPGQGVNGAGVAEPGGGFVLHQAAAPVPGISVQPAGPEGAVILGPGKYRGNLPAPVVHSGVVGLHVPFVVCVRVRGSVI